MMTDGKLQSSTASDDKQAQRPNGPSAPANATQPLADLVTPQELTKFIDSMLTNMKTEFEVFAQGIFTKMDEMGDRIDDLEKTLTNLAQLPGQDEPEATLPEGDHSG